MVRRTKSRQIIRLLLAYMLKYDSHNINENNNDNDN